MIDNREELATKMIDVLNGRGGFDDWWGNIDEECQEEITTKLVNVLPIQPVSGMVWMLQDTMTGMVMGMFKDQDKAIKFANGSNNISITNIEVI